MSSTPALSHAALDALMAGWRRIDRVEVGISPGNRARMGRSVMAAVLSWVGKPIRVFENGAWVWRHGWSHSQPITIAGLGRRRLALAETADLDCLVNRYQPRDAALFRAGLELPLLHRTLALLAWMPRLNFVRSLLPLTGFLHRIASWFQPFGTDRGGMIVEALGRDSADRAVLAQWTLVASAGDGPFVPTLPALALIRRLARGRRSLGRGARNGTGLLSLGEIAEEFQRLSIETRATISPLASPLEIALGPSFQHLPQAVLESHQGGPVTCFKGAASVVGPTHGFARLIGWLFGFPKAESSAPVRVTKRLDRDGVETWSRTFRERRFSSRLTFSKPGHVTEQFGPFRFDLAIKANSTALSMQIVGWSLGGLKLPAWLAPRSTAIETMNEQGHLAFDVLVTLPFIGRLVRYTGSLRLKESLSPRQDGD